MASRNQYSKITYTIACFSIIVSTVFLVNGCTDTITPDVSRESDIDEALSAQLDEELVEMLAAIQHRHSDEQVVRNAERHFSELSSVIPEFAAYKLDREAHEESGEFRLVVLLQGQEHEDRVVEQIRTFVSDRFGGNDFAFSPSDVTIKEVEYNFRQLQAFRDVLFGPIMTADGVTLFNLDDSRNRIVVGVEDEGYISSVEEILSEYPVPAEAVNIEVFKLFPQHSGSSSKSVRPSYKSLLTHQTVNDFVRPLTGGLEIRKSTTPDINCTLGTIAKWGTTDVFLTNSHCTDDRYGLSIKSSFHQPSPPTFIGEELHDRGFIPTYIDGEFIQVRFSDVSIIKVEDSDYEFGTVAMTNGRNINQWEVTNWQLQILHDPPRLKYIDEQESLINLPVAKVGAATGGTAGYVAQVCTNLSYSVEYLDFDFMLFCQDIASYYSQTGDSGAPVLTDYMGDTGPGEAKLLGIHHSWARDQADVWWSIFSPLEGIRYDFSMPSQPPHEFTFWE